MQIPLWGFLWLRAFLRAPRVFVRGWISIFDIYYLTEPQRHGECGGEDQTNHKGHKEHKEWLHKGRKLLFALSGPTTKQSGLCPGAGITHSIRERRSSPANSG